MIFRHPVIERQSKKRRTEQVGPRSEIRIDDFLAEFQRLLRHLVLVSPVSGKLREPIAVRLQAKHGRGIVVHHHRFLFPVPDDSPARNDIFSPVCGIYKPQLHRVDLVFEHYRRLTHIVVDSDSLVRYIFHSERDIAIGMSNFQGRLEIIVLSVHRKCLLPVPEPSDIAVMGQFCSEIALTEPPVTVYLENEVYIRRADSDIIGRRGNPGGQHKRQH